jgi:hypothetical protein
LIKINLASRTSGIFASMEHLSLIGFLAAAGLIALTSFLIARRRRFKRVMDTPVLLGEVMTRLGVTPADAAAAGREREIFIAADRCAACAAEPTCRAMLANSAGAELPAACPNHAFLEEIVAHKASQPGVVPRIPDSSLPG